MRRGAVATALAVVVAGACSEPDPLVPPDGPAEPDTLPWPLPGGAFTVADSTVQAYSRTPSFLTGDRFTLHADGRRGFVIRFEADTASTDRGLGPLFNQASCETCHLRGGRARDLFLLRLSAEGASEHGGPRPLPGFGVQLQDQAVEGLEPEARVRVRWSPIEGTYPDGAGYQLRLPEVTVERPYAPMVGGHRGLRAPPALIGLGLLDAVPDQVIEARADPGDADGDGVSGRANRVWNHREQRLRVGRFGWKANEPDLLQQVAAAYVEDMGVTSSLFPVEAVAGQAGHDDGLADDPELPDDRLESVTFFVRTLAVPARRRVNDPAVRRGEARFAELGCAHCHVPTLKTGPTASVPEAADQTIHPYTDLLVHDMGDDLADGRPDFLAGGSEWRTPPLWGLGLAETVQGHTQLLHDGRARTPEEAILWHGGEAAAARARFMALTAAARADLLAFLLSL